MICLWTSSNWKCAEMIIIRVSLFFLLTKFLILNSRERIDSSPYLFAGWKWLNFRFFFSFKCFSNENDYQLFRVFEKEPKKVWTMCWSFVFRLHCKAHREWDESARVRHHRQILLRRSRKGVAADGGAADGESDKPSHTQRHEVSVSGQTSAINRLSICTRGRETGEPKSPFRLMNIEISTCARARDDRWQ